MITQARLKQLLHYDPETGVFTWRERDPEVEASRSHRVLIWNDRHAGQTAGSPSQETGVVRIGIDGKIYIAHRLAYLYMEGHIPQVVRHRDENTTNNRWSNLYDSNWSELRTKAA